MNGWLESGLESAKREVEVYNQILEVFKKLEETQEEYLQEQGLVDENLFIVYQKKNIPLITLNYLAQSMDANTSISPSKKAELKAKLMHLYQEMKKIVKDSMIDRAVDTQDNIYLAKIKSCLEELESFIKTYGYLEGIKTTQIRKLDNALSSASSKVKRLKEVIEVRKAHIDSRITISEMRRK